MLTVKQERFVQELVKGKSQREAYKASYNAGNMKDATIDNKAYLLFKKDEIRGRYDELMSQIAERTIDDAEDMRQFILDKYRRIASGELCEETTVYNADGDVVQRKKTVRPNDVNNAIAKLAEYYGVKPEEKTDNEIHIIIEDANGYAD